MPLIRHRRAPCGARQSDHSEGGITFISTHAPFAGRDSEAMTAAQTLERFQPKRPLRGATRAEGIQPSEACISIHAPLAGRDGPTRRSMPCIPTFQSTRPLRGATPRVERSAPSLPFQSTRRGRVVSVRFPRHFNPRAPCGARRPAQAQRPQGIQHFNPRAPCGARPSNAQ